MDVDLDDLHDAILRDMSIDWESGTLTMTMNPCGHDARAVNWVVKGLKVLHVPRREPWGLGGVTVVNTVTRITTPDGDQRFVIELQSGDEIEVEAQAVTLHTST